MKQRYLFALFAFAFSFLPHARAADKVVIAQSTVGFAYLPVLVAKAMDLYKQEDIQEEIVITGGETKALAALVGGGAQVYVGSAPTVIRARENGVSALMVGYCVSQYATNFVMSKKWVNDHGLTPSTPLDKKLAAMKGGTFGITAPGSGTDLIMRYLAKRAKLEPDRDLTLSTLGTSETLAAAFAQGRIDGFALSAPVAELAVKAHGAVMILDLANGEVDELNGFLYSSITFLQSTLDSNPKLAVRILRVVQRALDAIRDPATTDEARDAVWKQYWPKVDKSLFDQIWLGWKNAWPKTVEIPVQSVQQMVDFTNSVDAKKISLSAAKAAYTNKFADEALGSIGK